MTTTQEPRPFHFLNDAANRINTHQGTPGDFLLLQEGYLGLDARGMYYIPNKHLTIKPSF
jgi:hypothetical protein